MVGHGISHDHQRITEIGCGEHGKPQGECVTDIECWAMGASGVDPFGGESESMSSLFTLGISPRALVS